LASLRIARACFTFPTVFQSVKNRPAPGNPEEPALQRVVQLLENCGALKGLAAVEPEFRLNSGKGSAQFAPGRGFWSAAV
jgi:hypothetical protein